MPKKPVKRHPVVQPLDKPYRFIPLTQGQNTIVDAEDFEWISEFNWHALWCPATKSFYARTKIVGCHRSMHINGMQGVSWHTGKWVARVTAYGVTVPLGRFESAEEAAHAYDEAAKELHGEFAYLNFP